jgi:hypothetical protein
MDNEYKILESINLDLNALQEEIRMAKKDVSKSINHLEERTTLIEQEANQDVLEQAEEIKLLRKDLIDSIEKKYKTIKNETMTVLGNHFESGWEEAKEEVTTKLEDLRARMDLEEVAKD